MTKPVAALHELHREVHAAVLIEPEFVHGYDAGVIELAGHLRSFEETRELLLIDGRRLTGCASISLAEHDLHRRHPM